LCKCLLTTDSHPPCGSSSPAGRRCGASQEMQAAAAVRRGATAWAASQFHSSAAVLSKSTPHIRFAVREKRRDAKSALKNILLNGSPYQESSKKQMRKQKGSGTPNVQRSYPGKNPYGKNKRKFFQVICRELLVYSLSILCF